MGVFIVYFGTCLIISVGVSCAGLGLWSNVGCGIVCFQYVSGRSIVPFVSAGVVLLGVLLLFLLDFFAPPHLPGTYFSLGRSAKGVERAVLLAVAVTCFVLCCSSVETVPTLPLLATILLCPASIGLAYSRMVTSTDVSSTMNKDLAFEVRMALLRLYIAEETEQLVFNKAASCALALTAVGCFAAGIVWLDMHGHGSLEEELDFVAWVAPFLAALCNLMFGSLFVLRIIMNKRYRETNEQKNRMLVEHIGNCRQGETLQHQATLMRARLTHVSRGLSYKQVMEMSEDKVQQYLTQHITGMEQLSLVMKIFGCVLIVLLMASLLALRLVSDVGRTKVLMALSVLGTLCLVFVTFVASSFRRLWLAMNLWIADLPIWESLRAVSRAPWARALVILVALPISPLLFLLCAMNQTVRRCRGLGTPQATGQRIKSSVMAPTMSRGSVHSVLEEMESSTVSPPQWPGCLTQRARNLLFDMQSWEWISIVWWWYVLAWVVFVLKITPVFLNPLLVWIGSLLENVPLSSLLLFIYLLGMFLFLLPPVPGPTVYAFAGMVVAKKSGEQYFWSSAIGCIVLCFVLKLTACIVQQKFIGQLFGGSLRVQKNVGVHKPFIRAIGIILDKPGLSRDKCMILCGGPDWPTSVLAGIMRISLTQCLKGTCPVVAVVIPLCLTGSLMTRKNDAMYSKLSEVMLLLSGMVSVGFWVGMAWAVQDAFDNHYGELTAPKREFLELDWLDYRTDIIGKRATVAWADVPALLRYVYVGGAFSLTLTVHFVLWRSKLCFTVVDIAANFSELELEWFGEHGFVRHPWGTAVLIAFAACSLWHVVFGCWMRRVRKARVAEAEVEVSHMESSWKARRMMAVTRSEKKGLTKSLTKSLTKTSSQFFWLLTEDIACEGSVATYEQDMAELSNKIVNDKVMSERHVQIQKNLQYQAMETE